MVTIALSFDAEVVDQQTLLNGTSYLSIEGEAEAGVWMLAVSFAQPKEAGAPLDEGDLTLTGPDGSVVAGLESGQVAMVVDDPSGDEQKAIDLTFAISGGDGAFAEAAGTVRLQGLLTAESLRIDATLLLEREESKS